MHSRGRDVLSRDHDQGRDVQRLRDRLRVPEVRAEQHYGQTGVYQMRPAVRPRVLRPRAGPLRERAHLPADGPHALPGDAGQRLVPAGVSAGVSGQLLGRQLRPAVQTGVQKPVLLYTGGV